MEMSRPHVLLADSSLRHYDCRLLLPMLLLLNSAASEASLSTTDIWWSVIIIIIVVTYYSAPDRRAEYCDDRVCVSVCLFASISPELHFWSPPNFCARYLWLPIPRSSSGSVAVAICCVLPFRLMTSCLHIMSRCTLQKERALKVTLQVALEAAEGAESAVYDCLVIRLHASYTKHENAAYCYRHSVVCVCVGHSREPNENNQTDWGVVWDMESEPRNRVLGGEWIL